MTRPPQTDTQSRVPFRTVLLSMALLWATYFVIATGRAAISGFEFQDEMVWRRLVVTLFGMGLTIVLWAILRLFDNSRLWVRVTAGLLVPIPIVIPMAQFNLWLFEDIQKLEEVAYGNKQGLNIRRDEAGNLMVDIPSRKVGATDDLADITRDDAEAEPESIIIMPAPTTLDRWRMTIDVALGRYFLLLAWASLYFAMLAGYQARTAERRAGEFREAARAAELRSLRYQVNPHFLFNTLNSLSALVMTGKAEQAEQMIQNISRFYRHSLADEPTSDVLLEAEFDLQRRYLDIEAVRFPERLRCLFLLPPELVDARVPGMILQPLVENSVIYAVSRVNRPVTIRLEAREEFDRLVISVSDDGPGVPDTEDHGFGIGLANVRDRLEARFGVDASFTSGPIPGGHRSEIRIPLSRND